VISDVEDAYALKRAESSGIKAVFIPWRKGHKSEWEAEAVRHLREADCELVCLAGFMRVVGTHPPRGVSLEVTRRGGLVVTQKPPDATSSPAVVSFSSPPRTTI
jgi:hypothetical protein